MTKAQWSAVYHYCTEYGYDSPREVLDELKANGTVTEDTRIAELGDYAEGKTYDAMYQFLADNL